MSLTSEAQAIILSGTLKAHSSVFGRDGEIVYDADDNSQYPRLKFLSWWKWGWFIISMITMMIRMSMITMMMMMITMITKWWENNDDDHNDDDNDLSNKLSLVGFRWTPLHSVGVDHPVEVFPACGHHHDGYDYHYNDDYDDYCNFDVDDINCPCLTKEQ